MKKQVHECEHKIHETLYNVQTLNTTAMGPATLASVMLASQHKLGSNVVICTDGEANMGLGSFNYGMGDAAAA